MSEETNEDSGGGGEKKDVVAGMKAMGRAEQLVALGAASFLLAFLFRGGSWKHLFQFGRYSYEGWTYTLGFLGSLCVLVLVITKLLGVKLVNAKLAAKLLVVCAAAPAVGWIIDSLKDFWRFLAIVSVAVMAFAATRLIASKD